MPERYPNEFADVQAQDDGLEADAELTADNTYMKISDGSPDSGNPAGKVVIRDSAGKIVGLQG